MNEGLSKQQAILIVDDNATNLGVIADYLNEHGFRIVTARSGEMGIQRARTAQPDLILLDVMMPEMDGFEACRRLKADEQTKDIPVIFMTALSEVEDKVRAFQMGGVDYITKPIQHEEVLARVETHLKIRQQAKELTQTNADKDKFFSIMAHDLKGPFMPLLGNAELLTEMGDILPPEEVKQLGASIQRTARSVFNLLENLLQWARLQMGRMEYHPESIELADLARKSVDLLQDNAKVKGIRLVNVIEHGIFVSADVYMLNTVIRNLTSNALKFTPQNGQVTISARLPDAGGKDKGFVEVSVSDTGVGISDEVKKKLFKIDQHVTTVGTGRETGTGLGLIMCHEMVMKGGGRIWVESELGKGTAVKFTTRFDKVVQVEKTKINEVSELSLFVEEPLFVAPAGELLKQCYEWILMGDMLAVKETAKAMIVENEALRPFANQLIKLASNFEEEELVSFLQKYMTAKE